MLSKKSCLVVTILITSGTSPFWAFENVQANCNRPEPAVFGEMSCRNLADMAPALSGFQNGIRASRFTASPRPTELEAAS
jgi:hypothetical protein